MAEKLSAEELTKIRCRWDETGYMSTRITDLLGHIDAQEEEIHEVRRINAMYETEFSSIRAATGNTDEGFPEGTPLEDLVEHLAKMAEKSIPIRDFAKDAIPLIRELAERNVGKARAANIYRFVAKAEELLKDECAD